MTSDGPIPFTLEEEAAWDAREAEFALEETARRWTVIRAERNKLLADTDWWVTKAAETGGNIGAEQHAYRQALRDITDQVNPFNIVWPVLPSVGA